MKKALHDDYQTFFSVRNGKVESWDSGIVDGLLSMVNQVLKEEIGLSIGYVNELYVFSAAMHDWMEQLVEDGVTDELSAELEEVRYRRQLKPSKSGKPSCQYLADFETPLDPAAGAAYGFSHLLEIGALEGLMQCQMSDCENFFIGRPNAKWCSTRCGARHRVRSKRKRDK